MEQKNISQLLVVVLLLILGIVVTMYDFDISKAFVNRNSQWGIFIEKYGELPGISLIWISLLICTSGLEIKNIFARIGLTCFNLLVLILLGQYFFIRAIPSYLDMNEIEQIKKFSQDWGMILQISMIIVTLGTFFSIHFFAKNFVQEKKKFAQITVWLALISQFFIQFFKTLWGRVRFRELSENLTFSPWYIPQGLENHHSFPSGHTGLGWVLLPFALFIGYKYPGIRKIVFILCIIWGILVAISRIKVGAHYASDVWFASVITIIPFIFLSKKHKI